MTVERREPSSDEPHLRLVASGGQGVQRRRWGLAAVQGATLGELAAAIAETRSMTLADAIVVLERARKAIPHEVAAAVSIFDSLAALDAR